MSPDVDVEETAALRDEVAVVPIDEVFPYDGNPKRHPDEQVDKIVSSIRRFGWDQPIVVDGEGVIIKGHGRLQAARRLGLDEVPVIEAADLSEAEARAARIADNRVAESDWDDELLAVELDLLDESPLDLDLTGFDEDEIDTFLDLPSGGPSGGGPGLDYEPGSLQRDFGVPPFSVLDTRKSYWTERRARWDAIGAGIAPKVDHIDDGAYQTHGDDNLVGGILNEFGNSIGREAGLLAGRGEGSILTGDWQESVGKDSGELGGNYDGTSTFDPVLAELLYRWFSPDPEPGSGEDEAPTILDPFAGGPARAFVAAVLGRRYVGVDINPEQVEANQGVWDEVVDPMNHGGPPVSLPEELDETPDVTPVEQRGDYWFKREDQYVFAGVNGAKVRAYRHLALEDDAEGIIGVAARVSPNFTRFAAVGKRLGIPVRVHTAYGEYTELMEVAEGLGAEIVQHAPGYMNQLEAAARDDAESEERDGWIYPKWGDDPRVHDLTVREVENVAATIEASRDSGGEADPEIQRVVVPVGSGLTLAAVLAGLKQYGVDVPVLGVRVGGDPEDALDRHAPDDWRDRVDLVESDYDYQAAPDETALAGVELDPVYEAKVIPYVEPGDLVWVVSTRETALADDDPRAGITTGDHPDVETRRPLVPPKWVEGDSADLDTVLAESDVPDVDEVDFVFSCPPYHDLERYTDLEGDLSNMDYEEFIETYRQIIARCLDRLKTGRFAAFVVSDIRDSAGAYRGFPAATIRAFVEAREEGDVHLYNEAVLVNQAASLPARARNMFDPGRKLGRQHQNILVFWKGDDLDPQAIGAAMGGSPDFGDAPVDEDDVDVEGEDPNDVEDGGGDDA